MKPPKPLTDYSAALQAAYLFGSEGRAWHPEYERRGGICWCAIGVTDGNSAQHRWVIYGQGVDWAEAFKDAAERGHG